MSKEYKNKLKICDDILCNYKPKKKLKIKEYPSKGFSDVTRKMLLVMLPRNILDKIEVMFLGLKAKRYCSVCGIEGHIKSTCPYFVLCEKYKDSMFIAVEKEIICKPVTLERIPTKDGFYIWEPDEIEEDYACSSTNTCNKLLITKTVEGRYFIGCAYCVGVTEKNRRYNNIFKYYYYY